MLQVHPMIERCRLSALLVLLTWSHPSPIISTACSNTSRPNIVIMLMDDMGWGDLGLNGDPSKETIHLDQMAREGMLLSDFYAANPLCSPSRASLLTGRLPVRNGFYTTNLKARNSYVPQDMVGGIAPSEILISELLAWAGYRNKIVGKWHLGHSKPDYFPLKRGFHEFYGTPNVHFGPYDNKKTPNVPMFRNDKMIGRLFENIHIDRRRQLSNLTQVYTQEAIEFIERQATECTPFFLYWTPDSLHAPTFRSPEFVGRSMKQSSYGDALIEIDQAVGSILDVIRRNDQLRNNTFVFFTSDNGAALVSKTDAGSNGPLLCGKQTTFEGGFREPAIAWWPSRIEPGTRSGQVSNQMDLFRTIVSLVGAEMPLNRTYDSNDLAPVLFDQQPINASMFFYRGDTLMALRQGPYKAHFWTYTNSKEEYRRGIDYCPGNAVPNVTTHKLTSHKLPVLFHLVRDPGERYPISSKSAEYKAAMNQIEIALQEHQENLKPGEPMLNICDKAAMNWAPEGCEELNMCLPKPNSAPYQCEWPH